ncbi:hypothetical protein SAMN04489735_100263 [Aneurinibacillus thermoaerophilus]|uniref:Uncharacterized protein n=1 Tax=Aneurinibacillus thermoaerophilus TaxID=143495 RepID=A0A1G7WQN1_ANETH|nr:hypothetical protein [Aneurinibacillus thermoaerophilus]SDG74168.1 hypothetical protein SAMN04489735_100263 [Aneurinibacillus thermoaerophilus]
MVRVKEYPYEETNPLNPYPEETGQIEDGIVLGDYKSIQYNKTNWDEQTAITPQRLNNLEGMFDLLIERTHWLHVLATAWDTLEVDDTRHPVIWRQIGNPTDKNGNINYSYGNASYFTRTAELQPLRVQLRTDDPDPNNPDNIGMIYLRTDL